MDTKTSKKANRLFLIVPFVIALTLLGGYGVLWSYGANYMRGEVDKFVENERRLGNTITYDKVSIRGFPIALRAQIENFNWAVPGSFDWSGEKLHIVATPTNLEQLIFVPRGPQALMTGGEYYSIAPNDLRVGISETKYSLEGTDVLIEASLGDRLSLGEVKANLVIDDDQDWAMIASARAVDFTDRDARHALFPGLRFALSQSPEDNGLISLDASEIGITDGEDGTPTLLKVDGKAGVDRRGYPEGQFNVIYRDERKLLALLEEFGAFSPAERTQVDTMLRGYRAGRTEAPVSFSMRDGELMLMGLVKVSDLPRVN